jgi:hypothetical protein
MAAEALPVTATRSKASSRNWSIANREVEENGKRRGLRTGTSQIDVLYTTGMGGINLDAALR